MPTQTAARAYFFEPDGTAKAAGTVIRNPELAKTLRLIAAKAEAADHHPDLRNSYRTVEVRLTTHSAGGVTEADLALVDPEKPWVVDSAKMAASAGNTPFDGQPVQGRVVGLWKGGKHVG